MILYQLYAFVLPAFSPSERRVAKPLLLLVPVLFIAGVVFGYFVVLTPAPQLPPQLQRGRVQHPGPGARLLLVRHATMLAMGIGFQMPVGILAAEARHHDAEKLRRNRRYAILVIVVAGRVPARRSTRSR